MPKQQSSAPRSRARQSAHLTKQARATSSADATSVDFVLDPIGVWSHAKRRGEGTQKHALPKSILQGDRIVQQSNTDVANVEQYDTNEAEIRNESAVINPMQQSVVRMAETRHESMVNN